MHEDELLLRLAAVVPQGVRVSVVADRGFGDTKLSQWLRDALHFDYLIRFRGVIGIEAADGECRKTRDGIGADGRMRVLYDARVTAARQRVPVVLCVQDRGMQDTWCLASSRADLPGSALKQMYGKRFTVDETFRDVKNLRLGLGLKQTVVTRNDRRDALVLLAVLPHALLTLLGKAGQDLGMERWLGATKAAESRSSARASCSTNCCPTCATSASVHSGHDSASCCGSTCSIPAFSAYGK